MSENEAQLHLTMMAELEFRIANTGTIFWRQFRDALSYGPRFVVDFNSRLLSQSARKTDEEDSSSFTVEWTRTNIARRPRATPVIGVVDKLPFIHCHRRTCYTLKCIGGPTVAFVGAEEHVSTIEPSGRNVACC